MPEPTSTPGLLGPIGARLHERVLQLLSDAQVGVDTSEAVDGNRGPLGERLRRTLQEALEDEDVQAVVGDAVWEGGTRLASELVERAPKLAINAIEAIGEAVADALTD